MRVVTMSVVLALAVFSLPVHAAKRAKPAPPAKATLVCPVTGEKIASIAKSGGKSVYKGKTYYFCCAACKPTFDKNPAKYVGKKK